MFRLEDAAMCGILQSCTFKMALAIAFVSSNMPCVLT